MVYRRVKNKNKGSKYYESLWFRPTINWLAGGLYKILFSVLIQKVLLYKNNIHKIIVQLKHFCLKTQYAILVLLKNGEMPRGNWTKAQNILLAACKKHQSLLFNSNDGNPKMQFTLLCKCMFFHIKYIISVCNNKIMYWFFSLISFQVFYWGHKSELWKCDLDNNGKNLTMFMLYMKFLIAEQISKFWVSLARMTFDSHEKEIFYL